MKNMDLMNENLALMNKINVIEQRDSVREKCLSQTQSRPPKMHNFND